MIASLMKGKKVSLSPTVKSAQAQQFSEELGRRIIGQEQAVGYVSDLFQVFLAGLSTPGRPVGAMLFLGPTGTGKTRVVEAVAEILHGDPRALIKVDCAEFQHPHEIAKLIGSPPGYIGHRETNPVFTQENLDGCRSDEARLSLVLFDEIEKASPALWQLLLGILDKASLTLADNTRTDFSRAVVVLTSNLGAREMSELVSGGMGFAAPKGDARRADLGQKLDASALGAARRTFSPEFMNRIDKTIVFRQLGDEDLRRILDLELAAVQERILGAEGAGFVFHCTDEAKRLLLGEGFDARYGARHLKRAVERLLVFPLSKLLASGQIADGDLVHVEAEDGAPELSFSKFEGAAALPLSRDAARHGRGRAAPSRDAARPQFAAPLAYGTAWGAAA
jgi:ATP-dependent Clp protease ATP-binding subunit ClpB